MPKMGKRTPTRICTNAVTRIVLLILLCLFPLFSRASSSSSSSAPAASDFFDESLTIRPLPDGKQLLHFTFHRSEHTTDGRHVTVLPKSLVEVLSEIHIHALSLSLTSGRWLTSQWGYIEAAETGAEAAEKITPKQAPFGAELWAHLDRSDALPALGEESLPSAHLRLSTNSSSVEARWAKLQAAFSGLFCASLNQMTTLTTSDPYPLFLDDVRPLSSHTEFRYATLPREEVCTENLAPFVKMLPCRDQRGISALLDPAKLFGNHYHSVQIKVKPLYIEGRLDGWRLEQSVSVVVDPLHKVQSASWSLSKMLSSPGTTESFALCPCPLSSRASLHVHLTPEFQSAFAKRQELAQIRANYSFDTKPLEATLVEVAGHSVLTYDLKRVSSFSPSELFVNSVCPRGGIDVKFQLSGSTDDMLTFFRRSLAAPSSRSTIATPFASTLDVQRFVSAPTQREGTLVLHLRNPSATEDMLVQLFDSLPWFCRVYRGSLTLRVNQSLPLPAHDLFEQSYAPAIHHSYPAQFYLYFRVSARSNVSISLEFDKSLLTAAEYPPDVSRGFDLSSAILRVKHVSAAGASSLTLHQAKQLLLEKRGWVRLYTDSALVLMPFPDFSMPFNVIAFTSTILAFFFGSVFNMTYSHFREVLKRQPDYQPQKNQLMQKLTALFAGKKKAKSE